MGKAIFMTKTRVGILFGGRSVEHDVSVISARNVAANIDQNKFEIFLIGISKSGNWFLCETIDQEISSGKPLNISLSATLTLFFTDEEQILLDVVFPVLHGTDGEDGSIQGLLHTVNIPCVGSGVLGSAASMDKVITKRVLTQAGIPTARFEAYSHSQRNQISFSRIAANLGLPFMLKPANLGSSVGVGKIKEEKDFAEALSYAFKFDNLILFEEYVSGREMECGIIGNDKPEASPAGEIKLSEKYEFYSFEAKYEDPDSTTIILPAEVDETVMDEIKAASIQAYEVLNCKDFARIDLFVLEDGTVRINEINTIPGFTNISMYPLLMRELGYEYTTLITRLIDLAVERHESESRISTQFDNNLR